MVNYYLGINPFKDGVAYFQWTLQPDGWYYADSDGFGIMDDDEINVYAFIDKKAHILVPLQPMDKTLRERYHKQAIEKAGNMTERPYVCLNPNFTIPMSENTNLEAHRELLGKLIYGMMLQYGAIAINQDNDPEYEGKIGILTAINPNKMKISSSCCSVFPLKEKKRHMRFTESQASSRKVKSRKDVVHRLAQ